METCKGCGAEIRWLKMKSGKMMPVDAKAKQFIMADNAQKEGHVVYGFVSHYATCPQADDFRKGGKECT